MFGHAYSYPQFSDVRSTIRRTVEPTSYPVMLSEIKRALDFGDVEDSETELELSDLIPEAVALVESDSKRSIMPQTWQLTLDRFPQEIELRRPPVIAVSSVKFIDVNEVEQTVDASEYQVDANSAPGRVRPVVCWPDCVFDCWPSTDLRLNAVTVEFTAGYEGPIPPLVKRAVLRAIKDLYHGCSPGDSYWSLIHRLRWTM